MKKKIPYNIRKSLIKILPFVATAIMTASCHKEPHDVIIDWDWDANIGWAPPKDSIKYYTDKNIVKTVYIHIIGRDGPNKPANCSGDYPGMFHTARDTLQTRFDIAPDKIRGMGIIYINSAPGADSMPNHNPGQSSGIAWYDKQWFEQNGWEIKPCPHPWDRSQNR